MSLATFDDTSRELVRFLLDRIDEDEGIVRRRARRERVRANNAGGTRQHLGPDESLTNVERLRAELSAKRQLIGCSEHLLLLRDQPNEKPVRDQAAVMLRVLAAPYQSHHDFRAQWR